MIHDLAIIMLTAGAVSMLFKFLKQPVVLGYILAGMLVGPYLMGKGLIDDKESVETWGQVGVIFLLFSLGLEFSFKKLLKVGSTAIISALVIVMGMMTTGFLVGRAMGWTEMNSLFLGGMLSMSSTTIVFKALDDLGLRQQQFAGISFGILVVEDLFAVVLMVLLSSIAVSQTFEGGEMLGQIAKLGAYLLFWFVAGIMLIPSFLKLCRKHLNEETLTIVAIGLCLGMVLLSVGAGFSEALGAFVMGSILAETVEAEHIEHITKPIKDMFGAVFFVSVGMMINPALLAEYWLPIAILTLTVIVGQLIFATSGVLLSGQPLKVAMQTSFTLMQVGEFAFIIASLGESLKVTEGYLYPVIVAVSVITTFLTPYTIRLAGPAYSFVDKRLPVGFKLGLERYASSRNTVTAESTWRKLLKKVGISTLTYLIIQMFIIGIYFRYLSDPLVHLLSQIAPEWVGKTVSLLVILGAISPFIYRIVTKHLHSRESHELWQTNHFAKGSLVALFGVRILLALAIVIVIVSRLFTLTTGVLIGISAAVVVLAVLSRHVQRRSRLIEEKFFSNINAREVLKDSQRVVGRSLEESLLSHNIHLADFVLNPESELCGKELKELNLRARSGVSLVRIVRGGLYINIPGAAERLYPGDHIVVVGTDEQIKAFSSELEQNERSSQEKGHSLMAVQQFEVTESMPFAGKRLDKSRIGELAQCVVVGIVQGKEEFLNPKADTLLMPGDLLIVAAEEGRIQEFLGSLS